jgi:hypothetical protein
MKVLFSMAVAVLMAAAPASKIELKFALESGKVYSQRTDLQSTTKQTMMGQEMEMKSNAASTTYFELKENEDNNGLYDLWYEDISLSFSGMGQEQSFSSEDGETPIGAILSKLVAKKFEARIKHDGGIEEVNGIEEIISAVTSAQDGEVNPMAEQISASFGANGLERNLESGLNIFPDKAVKKGDFWTKQQLSNSGMPLLIESKFTLASIEGGYAMIDVAGDINVDPENNTADLQGMEATYFLEGKRTGTLKVQISTGWVMEGHLKDDIAGSITIAASAMLPDGMTLPMETVNNITILGTIE